MASKQRQKYVERNDEIYWHREHGMTYLEIGKKYGLTVERVRQIYVRQKRMYKYQTVPDWRSLFNTKVYNALSRKGIKTEAAFYDAVRRGTYFPYIGTGNVKELNKKLSGAKVKVIPKYRMDNGEWSPNIAIAEEENNE